ncbi:MAG: thioredoxin domain-containing protein [Saprospiraceae bacterium]|nr:thioredoxin domain-containing protein [Saprospiraceae bacterium]MDW8230292.1 thioredoxin domain-containing protein [Saprospiraceae bacterium]
MAVHRDVLDKQNLAAALIVSILRFQIALAHMNRLQYESSPYLQQHAHNPVDWYAWKPEAFERARRENKPILVSIGYSTCHWCHVMERESFENPDVAAFMNEHFVNIKVDREERPDVDAIYMEACQIMTGGGGWPLNCFLTPEGKPFYAGTYFPPRPAYNRPSWLQLLQHMANAWETKREAVYEQANRLMTYLERSDNVFLEPLPSELARPPLPVQAALENAYYVMRDHFDRVEGGFGGAPKFPSSMALHFLLYYHRLTGNTEALEHALFSLDKMICGGIYDQLGGGFARYATDRAWLVPHFEKMLYDNALLVSVLADACRLLLDTDNAHAQQRRRCYEETIAETLEFVRREMTHPGGAFFSALDADSEGQEGKFYVWDKAEIEEVLGSDAELFCALYGVSEQGNWEETNILWRAIPIDDYARQHGLDAEALRQQVAQWRRRLFERRSQRIRPGLDDKILLGWNALMASAYAHAHTALGRDDYRDTAVRNVDFLLQHFINENGRLLHSWKDGRAQYAAVLEDYAFFIAALLDVWHITFEQRYLDFAQGLTEQVYTYYYDAQTNLFYYTAADQADVILRKKDLYDNATPSGNSTMAHNLQRLGILLDRGDWREHAEQMVEKMRPAVERYPLSFERWALALLLLARPRPEVAVVGRGALSMAQELQRHFTWNAVVAAAEHPDDNNPLLRGKAPGEHTLYYVCRNYACQRPVSTLEEALMLL